MQFAFSRRCKEQLADRMYKSLSVNFEHILPEPFE